MSKLEQVHVPFNIPEQIWCGPKTSSHFSQYEYVFLDLILFEGWFSFMPFLLRDTFLFGTANPRVCTSVGAI